MNGTSLPSLASAAAPGAGRASSALAVDGLAGAGSSGGTSSSNSGGGGHASNGSGHHSGGLAVGSAGAPKARSRWFASPRTLRFTREGKWIVALSLAIGLAAINTGNNLLYLLVAWLLSFIVASGVLSESTMRRVRFSRRVPTMVFAGEPVDIEIVATNDKATRSSYSLEVEELIGDEALDKRCYFLRIPAGATQTTQYRHIFPRRGVVTLSSFRVATRFPFGFFHKSKIVDHPTPILVLPARVPVRPLAPQPTRRGDDAAGKVGREGEFYGIREQRLGDDRRSIHWASTAKMGRLMVKERETEQAHQATIFVEHGLPAGVAARMGVVSPSRLEAIMGAERAISYTASLAAHLLERGYVVEVVGRGFRIAPASGRAASLPLLRGLAELELTSVDVGMSPGTLRNAQRFYVAPRTSQGPRPDAAWVEV